MSATSGVISSETARYNLTTLVSVAIVACVSADMVHEALGHGTASLLTGDRILSLSTVAIQNATGNRLVSAAGTVANCLVGVAALLLLRRTRRFTAFTYFLWIFGAFNLLNSGYLVASAIMNSGDWANVIVGFSPPLLWRCILGLAGVGVYIFSVRWIASSMTRLVEDARVALPEMRRLVLPGYLAAGMIMTIASVFNPIGPLLILGSGVAPSFGLNAGLLFVPGMVTGKSRGQTVVTEAVPRSFIWLVLAIAIGGVFIAVLGPGIHFSE